MPHLSWPLKIYYLRCCLVIRKNIQGRNCLCVVPLIKYRSFRIIYIFFFKNSDEYICIFLYIYCLYYFRQMRRYTNWEINLWNAKNLHREIIFKHKQQNCDKYENLLSLLSLFVSIVSIIKFWPRKIEKMIELTLLASTWGLKCNGTGT